MLSVAILAPAVGRLGAELPGAEARPTMQRQSREEQLDGEQQPRDEQVDTEQQHRDELLDDVVEQQRERYAAWIKESARSWKNESEHEREERLRAHAPRTPPWRTMSAEQLSAAKAHQARMDLLPRRGPAWVEAPPRTRRGTRGGASRKRGLTEEEAETVARHEMLRSRLWRAVAGCGGLWEPIPQEL